MTLTEFKTDLTQYTNDADQAQRLADVIYTYWANTDRLLRLSDLASEVKFLLLASDPEQLAVQVEALIKNYSLFAMLSSQLKQRQTKPVETSLACHYKRS